MHEEHQANKNVSFVTIGGSRIHNPIRLGHEMFTRRRCISRLLRVLRSNNPETQNEKVTLGPGHNVDERRSFQSLILGVFGKVRGVEKPLQPVIAG